MEHKNVLNVHSRKEFRKWLEENHENQKECYVACKRGKPSGEQKLYYIDAVEEALCFGWIDSTLRKIDGVSMQRFSPRNKKSNWTELNKERVRRLEKLGLMTNAGRACLPNMEENSFIYDDEIIEALKKVRAFNKFMTFHPLYRRVKIYNLVFCRNCRPEDYEKMLSRFIEATKNEKMIGEWNDYGRLLEY